MKSVSVKVLNVYKGPSQLDCEGENTFPVAREEATFLILNNIPFLIFAPSCFWCPFICKTNSTFQMKQHHMWRGEGDAVGADAEMKS